MCQLVRGDCSSWLKPKVVAKHQPLGRSAPRTNSRPICRTSCRAAGAGEWEGLLRRRRSPSRRPLARLNHPLLVKLKLKQRLLPNQRSGRLNPRRDRRHVRLNPPRGRSNRPREPRSLLPGHMNLRRDLMMRRPERGNNRPARMSLRPDRASRPFALMTLRPERANKRHAGMRLQPDRVSLPRV